MRLLPYVLALGFLTAASVARADDDARDTHMRSPPLLGSGIGLATLGGLAIPIGGFVLILPKAQPMCVGCSIDYSVRDFAGVAFLAGGFAAVAASIPMIVYGAHRIPITISPAGPLGSSGLTLAVKF